MSVNLQEQILQVLRGILDGAGNKAMARIESAQVDAQGSAVVVLNVDPNQGAALEPLRQSAERALLEIKGISKAMVILTAEKKPERNSPPPDPHGMNKNPPLEIPAKKIILVASGKGGVGKSTIAANIAAQLGKRFKVGLLDADIYGPSQPLMMGAEEFKPVLNAQRKFEPLQKHGLKVMSIGFLTEAGKALVWRGPMVQTAVYQMLRDVAWADADGALLDYLIIDMPPGTGDVQLTLAQKVKADGAVIVSTPQDIALIDARRAVEMFQKTNVPVLGIIENMSVHICENCGHEEYIFGHNGARDEAAKLGVPFLGAVPLAKTIRTQSDGGMPIVLAEPEGKYAQAFAEIALRL